MIALKEVYAPYFKIGAAVNRRTINSHRGLLERHFNSLTCENEMKFSSVYKKDGTPDFADADTVCRFAVENGYALRGHTLVWHNQTPDFVFEGHDRERTLGLLDGHMAHMARRYGRHIHAWDVVNEAVEDRPADGQAATFLRQTKWLDILGADYIAEAFAMAARHLPDATLYYNDYNESDPGKREKIYRLLKGLRDNGVPVHGMGMQMHVNIYGPSIDDIKRSVEQYATLGVRLAITEMDVSLFAFDDHSALAVPGAALLERQAEYYRQCFAVFRAYADHIDSVTLWGVADDETWLSHFPVRGRKNWPLLFDDNHEPKEAFWRVAQF